MQYTATYSPDDNKLRLYASARLDRETFERVKAAGFKWAPRQELFVAPMWTPGREDLLIELAGEVGDEDTSLVERAEERADRFSDYSDSRTKDAEQARRAVAQIADAIPFGQPILVGHHSERHARKDAERIENGMRRAVQMWDTAQYWKSRAAGALRAAKYKERTDVRARRIKTIEADKRKALRAIEEAQAFLKAWAAEGLTMERAKAIANRSHVSRCFPLADYPREAPASQYEGPMSIWSALDGGVITPEQGRDIETAAHARVIERQGRWVAHYDNRLSYERAMLEEQGGLAGERFTLEVGGQVLAGGEWLTILRLNKVGDQVVSVTTNARYVRVRSIEEITDYRAPSAERAATVKAATKLPPLVNYAGEGFIHITQAQWEAIPKDYKGTEKVKATDTTAAHRVRVAMGCYVLKGESDWNKRHGYPRVYITDAKASQPPQAAQAAPAAEAPAVPAPVRELPAARPVQQPEEPNDFDRMRQQLRAGVQVVSAPQLFPTPADLAARMVELAELGDGARVLEPSAGTGRLVQAVKDTGRSVHIVAVEVNHALARTLNQQHSQAAPVDVPQAVEVIARDFMELKGGAGADGCIGQFDAVVMNPPFEGAADVRHIVHALRMVKPGGRLVAICANGPRQQAVLRPLVEQHGGEWEELPADTFKAEGTGVRTALLALTA